MPTRKSFMVLLVEDSPDDIEFMRQAFAEITEYRVCIEIVMLGKGAIDILGSATLKPHFIILDWNLPDMIGADVLQEIKSSLVTRSIPVFVFTTSKIRKDIEIAYNNHCNGYIEKPFELDELVEVLRAVLNYLSKTILSTAN